MADNASTTSSGKPALATQATMSVTEMQLFEADEDMGKQRKSFVFWFRHPGIRIFVASFIVICNFYIYAEDPVAHSRAEALIPVAGSAYSFVMSKYAGLPAEWVVIKVVFWLLFLLIGILFGKYVVQRSLRFFCQKMGNRMFDNDQGTWMMSFFSTAVWLYIGSSVYSGLVVSQPGLEDMGITDAMGMTNVGFMKITATGTWLGDAVTCIMCIDVILQEKKLYPDWGTKLRAAWTKKFSLFGKQTSVRVFTFWFVMIAMTALVVGIISVDETKRSGAIVWESAGGLLSTNEMQRGLLAAFITFFDLAILMQDWEFPDFRGSEKIQLPGFDVSNIRFTMFGTSWLSAVFSKCFKCCDKDGDGRVGNNEIVVNNKWFQYGVILIVMGLDLNMLKNQIFYEPTMYYQYTDPSTEYIYSITDVSTVPANLTDITWEKRQCSGCPGKETDEKTSSKYHGYGIREMPYVSIPLFVGITMLIVFTITESRRYEGLRTKWKKIKKLGAGGGESA